MSTSGRWGFVMAVVAVLVVALVGLQQRPGSPPAGTASPLATGRSSPAPPTIAATSPNTSGPSSTPTGAVVLVGAGDIADCASDRDEATADLVESIDGIVFTLGDNVYERGTAREFADCYGPSWGRPSIKDRTRPVAGNHEYETAGAAAYFDYFGAAAGNPDEGWYAYDAGAWRIYVLNSNCDEIGGCGGTSRQLAWLRADLAANPHACVAAMWHHPRFSSGEHGNDDRMERAWRVLGDAGAELVLAGHDHDYERFASQDEKGRADPDRGLVEIVVGTGGRNPYRFQAIRDNSLVRASGVAGVLRLDLAEGFYSYEFMPIAGSSFTDDGAGICD